MYVQCTPYIQDFGSIDPADVTASQQRKTAGAIKKAIPAGKQICDKSQPEQREKQINKGLHCEKPSHFCQD